MIGVSEEEKKHHDKDDYKKDKHYKEHDDHKKHDYDKYKHDKHDGHKYDYDKHEKHDEHKKNHDDKLEKQNEENLKKIKDLQEALLRTQADNVNYRKRKDEEVAKRLEYANEDLVKEILPVVDNFERAISLDDDNLDDELSKFLQGFKMIYCHLVDILNKYDVKAIDGANKPFDPKYHQAVLTEKVDGMESGMVIEVMQKGYLFKDKVIRPAMVKVSE